MKDRKFVFMASINIPSNNHYNVLLKDPFLQFQEQKNGFYVQDGLVKGGVIHRLPSVKHTEIKPYLSIYKLDSDVNH